MPKILQDRVVFDHEDFLAGLNPQFVASGNKKLGKGSNFMREFDPYRSLGFASPGFSAVNATNAAEVTAVIKNAITWVTGTDSHAFMIQAGDKLHRCQLQGSATDTLATSYQAISTTMGGGHSGHTPVGSDIVRYAANVNSVPTELAFYSWQDGTDWDVGMHTLATSPTFNSDFMSTVPASPLGTTAADLTSGAATRHPMYVSKNDGLLYIASKNIVHSFDGYTGADGTFNRQVLDIPAGFIITSFAEYDKYLVVFAHRGSSQGGTIYTRGEAIAYFWDRVSSAPNFSYDLDDNYVSGGFIWQNTIGCFTQGRSKGGDNKSSALKLFDGSKFLIPDNCIFNDNVPDHGGVEVFDNMIHWNSSGKIYCYGTPINGVDAAMTHRCTGSGTTSGGFLKNLTLGKLYSSSTGTNYGLQTFSTGYEYQGYWDSSIVDIASSLGRMVEIERVKVYFANVTSGGLTFTLKLLTERNNVSTTILSSITAVTTFGTAESATSKHLITEATTASNSAPLPACSSLGIQLGWGTGDAITSAPQISMVEVFLKPYSI